MHITSFGNCFIKLNIKSPLIGDSVLFIDPFSTKTWGMRQPKMEADIVLLTNPSLAKGTALPKNAAIISEPGEYEHREIFIIGKASQTAENKNNLTHYLIEAENMTLMHLGASKQTTLTNGDKENLQRIDILFIPIGGHDSLTGKQAAVLVQELEPRVVIPIHYKYKGAKTNLNDEKEFLRELGNPKTESNNKISIKKKDLPNEEMKIFLIHP